MADVEGARPGVRAIAGGILLFGLPSISGMIVRVAHGQSWFGDFRAVVCGAQHLAAGQPLYILSQACPDPSAAKFVYLPWVAAVAGAFRQVLGGPGFAALYVLIFAAAVIGMVGAAAVWSRTPGPVNLRTRFLAFVGGGAITAGNVAVPLQAAVGAAALASLRWPWLFVAAAACAGAVKPVFLSYLAVILLSRRPLAWRLGACGVGAAAGLAPSVFMLTLGGETGQAWWRLLGHFVHQVTPGAGLFGWMSAVGLGTDGPGGMLAALAWASLVVAAAAAAADRAQLGDLERVWVGLACAILANPRLMGEDLFLLGPGVLILTRTIAESDPARARLAENWVTGACILALLGRLWDFAHYGQPVAVLMIAIAVLGAGAAALRPAARTTWAGDTAREAQ